MTSRSVVLDASAVLAVLFKEPGSAGVERYLQDGAAAVSAVNAAEVLTKLHEVGVPAEQAARFLSLMGIDIVPFDLESAERTARLRPQTKPIGLSLGDRACLALGQLLACPVLTADRSWAELDIGIDIVVIR